MVGMTGFEPATSSSRTKRATKLRYIPIRCKSNFTRIADAGSRCEILAKPATRALDQGILPGPVQVGEASTAADQFPRGAVLNDPAIVHHQDAVRRLHCGQPVRDDQRRP